MHVFACMHVCMLLQYAAVFAGVSVVECVWLLLHVIGALLARLFICKACFSILVHESSAVTF